ncbi:MAG: SPL family radical SAM protein [Planctomycetota bacterium]
MDTADKFKPQTILLWQKVKDSPEAQRIIHLFPSTKVQLIKHQRMPSAADLSPGQALRNSKSTLMIGETSSFVGQFDGQLGPAVQCCPYYKLVPLSNGCPYYCTYCYLGFVYRKYSPFIKLNVNYETMLRQIRQTAAKSKNRTDFNMGEMLDSLALDHITNLTTKVVPFMKLLSNAHLMLLTKSSNIRNLLAVEPNSRVVISWSLNPQHIIDRYEPGTASLNQRIEAAKACQQHGYRVRFRIDPGILYSDWPDGYTQMIKLALAKVDTENITIGMLRLLPGHKRLAIDAYGARGRQLDSHELIDKASDGKMRYHIKRRVEFYNFLIDVIRSYDKSVSISLCRETSDAWQQLKDRCDHQKCNCVTWQTLPSDCI